MEIKFQYKRFKLECNIVKGLLTDWRSSMLLEIMLAPILKSKRDDYFFCHLKKIVYNFPFYGDFQQTVVTELDLFFTASLWLTCGSSVLGCATRPIPTLVLIHSWLNKASMMEKLQLRNYLLFIISTKDSCSHSQGSTICQQL